jgi:Histone methylation protein DOT1
MLMQISNSLQEEILSDIENIGNDLNLCQEKNFNARTDAIDYLEFHVIDRLNTLIESRDIPDKMNSLKEYALKVKGHLEVVNRSMFQRLRSKISEEDYRGNFLMELIDEHFDNNTDAFFQNDTIGYDNLDIFLNGLLANQDLPVETKNREREMVYYQKTPARIILELIKKAEFKRQDVFIDLGSGLGQVTILVHLLSSVISKGVEFEPAFCSYAKASAADLHLNNVEFINKDARYADYSSGTIFYLYTPFEGKMLRGVLQNLNVEAKKRKIKIFTFGPCTFEVAIQNWLIKEYEVVTISGVFCEFHSV